MGRLPAGVKPTPHKVRLQKYRTALEESGGHRLIADIEAPAHEALKLIMELDTPPDAEKPMTQKDATTNALLHYAKVVRRRAG